MLIYTLALDSKKSMRAVMAEKAINDIKKTIDLSIIDKN